MQRCGYSRHETLHELPAVFVNQTVALWWQQQGVEVELLTTTLEREKSVEDEIRQTIERDHSWLSELH